MCWIVLDSNKVVWEEQKKVFSNGAEYLFLFPTFLTSANLDEKFIVYFGSPKVSVSSCICASDIPSGSKPIFLDAI